MNPAPRPRSAAVTGVLLGLGVLLIGIAQVLSLQCSAVAPATGSDPAPLPTLVAAVADHAVAPALRLFGDPDPARELVLERVQHVAFAAMLFGLVLVVLGARRIQLAKRALKRR